MKDLQFGGNMYIVLVYDISQSEAGQKRWSRIDRKSTRLNSSHSDRSRMPSSA